jgi:ribosomal protein S6
MDPETKNYEIAYLISAEIPEDEVFGVAGKITGAIQDARGLVGKIEEPKKRRLAYPIKISRLNHTHSYFGWTRFTIAPEHLKDLEKQLKLEKQIVRHLIVEEVKRPVYEPRFRPDRPRNFPTAPLEEVKPFTPQAPKEEDKTKIEELDKQLEEILGN